MGRVIGTESSGSDSLAENSRMRPDKRNRGKQKKRKKDLEELHRNVLEAKRKLHRKPSRETKWKTAFAKVLANFADQRQHNDDTTHDRKRNKTTHGKRTICNRLLPEPILGMYENGAKGKQAHRAGGAMGGTQIARLESNVFKLLNGDETNSNSSGNSEKKRAKNIEPACTKRTVESNSTSESSRFAVDSPVLDKTKGDKWINRDTGKKIDDREEPVKPRDQPHRQRDNTCKRRLFEPDDENACDENSFRIIDRSKIMDEICFSPTRRMDVDNSGSDNRVKKYPIPDENGAREISERKLDFGKSTKKFWDCSPYVHYEKLCTKVLSENFENDVQRIGRDPMIKIRKDLDELYAPSNHWMEIIIGETDKRCQFEAPSMPQNSPLENFSVSTLAETENRTSGLELDQESSDSWTIKVGSWHSSNFCGISSENDDNHIRDKSKKSRVEASKSNEDEPQRSSKKNNVYEENSLIDDVARTINPVSLFLKSLGDKNLTNGRKGFKTFAAEIAAAAESHGAKEKSDNYVDEPRDTDTDNNLKSRVRKYSKHVPTILRRPNSRSRLAKRINENHQDTRWRIIERVDSRKDIQFKDHPRHSSGSSSSTITEVNDSDLIETPRIASDLLGIESDDLTNLNLTRRKSKPSLKSIERDLSWEGSPDVESSDDTSRNEPVPIVRYVEKADARKSRTRAAQSRGMRKRRVTFDVDERPFDSSQMSKPRDQSTCLLPAPNNYESLATYHDNPRSEASRIFSRHENGVEIPPQDSHDGFTTGLADIERRSINRSFGACNLSSERFANESKFVQPCQPEQRIRKPVMLFKPIRSMGDNRQTYRSSYETLDKTFASVSEAVRHLNVRSYPEKPGDPSCFRQQQSAISPVCQNHGLEQQHRRYPKQALTQTVCKNPLIPINENDTQRDIIDIQPTKYLAVQEDNGDPQRFPVCAYVDRPRVIVEPVSMVFDDTNNVKFRSINCPETKNPIPQQQHHHHHYYHQVDPACAYRSSTHDAPRNACAKMPSPTIPPPGTDTADRGAVTVFGLGQQCQSQISWAEHQEQLPTVVTCSRLCSQQHRLSNDLAPAAVLTLVPTSNDVPRNGCDVQLACSQLKYKPRYNVNTGSNGGFVVNSRVQLADGKIGTFIPDNRPAFGMGQQSRRMISRGSRQLPLVGTRSSPLLFQQHASNGIAVSQAKRNVCRIADCEHVASTNVKYKPQYNVANFNGNFNEHETLLKRVQLADGTTGTFIPESRPAGSTGFFNDDRRTFDSVRTDETGYPQELCVPASQKMCSLLACQCNPVYYNSHEAYPDRVTCAIRNKDTFTAL